MKSLGILSGAAVVAVAGVFTWLLQGVLLPRRRGYGWWRRWTYLMLQLLSVLAKLGREASQAVGLFLSRRGDLFWLSFLTGLGALIYLPFLGSYPLWDPWEPHYTQVAWEMEQRATWVNPWYRGHDNWWSKPILLLWMLRASLGVLWDPLHNFANHELAARLPFALFAIAGGLLQFHWVSRLYNRAAGVLAAVVLITGPQYLLLGRQVIIDIPFVATYAASMGYLAVGLFTPRPPLAPFDAPPAHRAWAWWLRNWPFAAFWSLQAIAMLAKGFVPTTLAVLVGAGYWLITFRWRDYSHLTAHRVWASYILRRGGLALTLLTLLGALVYGMGRPPFVAYARSLWRMPGSAWLAVAALTTYVWVVLGALIAARQRGWRQSYLGAWLATTAASIAVTWVWWHFGPGDHPATVGLALLQVTLLLGGAYLTCVRQQGGTTPRRSLSVPMATVICASWLVALVAWFAASDGSPSGRAAPAAELRLYQMLLAGAGLAGILLGVLHDLPPVRHAWHLLRRMRAGWGLMLFIALGAPWFVYMSFEHGWPYWNEWLFLHHLGRAAGTIGKPNQPFDYYVRQIAVGYFPWSAFTLAAGWHFLHRSNPYRSIAGRRDTYIVLCAALPFLFFALSGTKFAHYVFPIVPFLGVIVAVTLVRLGSAPAPEVPLAEDRPPMGPPLPAQLPPPAEPWWKKPGAKGTLLVFTAVSLISFGIVAHDLALDFRMLLRLFIYYFNRATPNGYFPFVALQLIFVPLGLVMATLLLGRWVSRWHRVGLGAGAVVFACYIGWVTMPAMEATYSFKPFLTAYEEMAKPGEEIGQYNDWQQPVRSVIFLFQNRAQHLRNDNAVKRFLQRPGRKFILVDQDKLPRLRRVARDMGQTLYVVSDDHPYGRMVSNEPNPQDARRAAQHILQEVPAGVPRVGHEGARFEDSITLLAAQVEPRVAKPGQTVKATFYYRCEKLMDHDWQIFVHGDGPRGSSGRIHRDHFPVGGNYPTTEWQVGEIIRDEFEVPIPGDYPYDYFVLWTGWYRGSTRMDITSRAPTDGDRRVRGPTVRIQRD